MYSHLIPTIVAKLPKKLRGAQFQAFEGSTLGGNLGHLRGVLVTGGGYFGEKKLFCVIYEMQKNQHSQLNPTCTVCRLYNYQLCLPQAILFGNA